MSDVVPTTVDAHTACEALGLTMQQMADFLRAAAVDQLKTLTFEVGYADQDFSPENQAALLGAFDSMARGANRLYESSMLCQHHADAEEKSA